MKTYRTIFLLAFLSIPLIAAGQETRHLIVNVVYSPAGTEIPDDPGYALYKKGYGYILNEQWADAKKQFSDLMSRYPQSAYVDDAAYWSAYATARIDHRKGIAAYQQFLKQRTQSAYYNDAVADLDELQPPSAPSPPPALFFVHPGDDAFPAFAPNMDNLQRQLRRQLRQMQRLGSHTPPPEAFFPNVEIERLDPPTRLKMQALYALGEMKDDNESFQTLKQVALDSRQLMPLREAALEALSQFRKHDPVSVYVSIVKNDTSREMQNLAIDFIGETGKDKKMTVKVLGELYEKLPPARRDVQRTIVYTIADVGNDAAIDFLATIASGRDNDEVRSDAIYYLGTIGGSKARTILYKILKGNP